MKIYLTKKLDKPKTLPKVKVLIIQNGIVEIFYAVMCFFLIIVDACKGGLTCSCSM